jgi:hypothetical protein
MIPPMRIWLTLLTFCAFLLGSASAWAAGASVDEATDDQKGQARDAFLEAKKAFDEKRFDEALAGFNKSYDIVASPNSHLMVAFSMRDLGRKADAYNELLLVKTEAEEAAAKNPKYQSAVDSATQDLEVLRGELGFVSVEVTDSDPGGTLTVGGQTVDRDKWGQPIAVEPGTVSVSLKTATGSANRDVTVAAGATESVQIETVPTGPVDDGEGEETDSDDGGDFMGHMTPMRWGAYAAVGLGVVSFAVAGGLGGAALSQHSDLEDACGAAPCVEDRQDDIDSGRTLQTASNVMIVVGAVLVGGGVALYFLAPDANEEEAEGDEGVDEEFARITNVSVGPGSLVISGTF